jgi:Domain of unknown function (DUF4190)
MPLSLTCVCGARFDLDDTLAGQNVACPECQQPLKAPALQRAQPRTSGLALASIVLALTGAFTVIGTVAAVVLGFLALTSISRRRDQLAGAGLAVFGIVAGIIFTTLTLLAAFGSTELFGLGAWMRKNRLADQVDTTGPRPLEIKRQDYGFAISLPSRDWGTAIHGDVDDPIVHGFLQKDTPLLLVQQSQYAFVDVRTERVNARRMKDCQESVLFDFQPKNARVDPLADDRMFRPMGFQKLEVDDLPSNDGVEGRELRFEALCPGQRWKFRVRLYLTSRGELFIVRGFCQANRFGQANNEFTRVLDTFRILRER